MLHLSYRVVSENEHVILVPFDPIRRRVRTLITSFGEKRIKNGPGKIAFAVYDKPKSYRAYAGIITYINFSAEDLISLQMVIRSELWMVRVRKEEPRVEEFAYGQNVAVLSVCWDDWEAGAKEQVNAVMARTK
ncbi:hypothetical protein IW261DRAFT_1415557 [Armillaria novae-zelandiae]|uniref:Uncharacterized protein n=1 Tax=Armillaria novae-zelandiae TaxID=153914 RepID=A0AA39TGQ4_9AGAR|nr:hypothetical protein IW261DRAFT_1415557 [Armillaria novae-zelandiae]